MSETSGPSPAAPQAEYEVAIIYTLLHLHSGHYGIFLLEDRVIFPNARSLGFVEISFVTSFGGMEIHLDF